MNIEAGKVYRAIGIGMYYAENSKYRCGWTFSTSEDDGCDGYGWLDLSVTEIVETDRSGMLVVYYRRWYDPEGNPFSKPYRRVAALSSVKALIRKRNMVEMI